MNLLSKRKTMEKDVEIDPRSVVSYDSENNDANMNFIERDLRRQIWLFCKQNDIDFKSLKFSDTESNPVNENEPKGLIEYKIMTKIKNLVTLQDTVGAKAVYEYVFLVKKGIINE